MSNLDLTVAQIPLWRGELPTVLKNVRFQTERALAQGKDRLAYTQCAFFVNHLRAAAFAKALLPEHLQAALEVIENASTGLTNLAGGNPPWYDVLCPALTAELLSLSHRHDEALALCERAAHLAQTLWKEALPRILRIGVVCLADADRWDQMEPFLDNAERAAKEEEYLAELATIQAFRVAYCAQRHAPEKVMNSALEALNATFLEMNAPRVEGETWLTIQPYLPLNLALPDLPTVVDQLLSQFLDMPMPEPASRCYEWLGDIHAARGDIAQAESCFRLALGIFTRHGLRLRMPLVESKLQALPAPKAT
ncbi:MAG: hypothetical protein IPK82_36375 [Polyangiaceae bacterium]|nr:hypothetical protein [Polyangiaceae bacterium]